ncbi:retention module-containing protein [Halomonas sp.]|uniref:retention module-containing protein n=1 Tax=Halomonas sp. TaxID=1486246 RepID=UPI00384DD5DE
MTIATVISITGQAWARDADGNLRELRVGDTLQEGETLVTADNASVQLDFGDGLNPTLIEGGQQVAMTPELDSQQSVAAEDFSALDEDLEALLTAIDEGEGDLLADLDATAAGAGPGGGAEGGHTFVMLGRIDEDVSPLNFDYGMGQLGAGEFPEDEPALLAEEAPVIATVSFELFGGELDLTGGTVFEGNTVTVIATVDVAPVDSPLVITLSNGQQIVIPVGETSGETVIDTREDDLFLQGDESIDLSVTGTTGGGYDELTIGEIPGITVIDDADVATVTLTGTESVTELDDITLTATVDNAPESDLLLTLNNGETITILAGETSGSVTFASPNVPDGDGEETFTIDDADGGNYEVLELDGASHTTEIIDRLPEAGEEADQLNDAALSAGNAETSGALAFDFGGDGAGNVSFAAMDGETATLGTEAITYSWNPGTNTLTATGPRGELFNVVVDSDSGAYTATLVDNVLHEEGSDLDSLALTYTVTDADGSTADGVLSLSFVDDVPNANEVAAELAAGEFGPLTGNAMTDGTPDTEGADTARVTEVVVGNNAPVSVPESGTVDVTGEYGVLTIEADGSYSYARNPGTPGGVQDVFTYTLTDADGDSDTATLTIGIGDAPVTISGLSTEGPDLTVDEANLEDGSSPDDGALTQTGSFTITALDGVADLTVGGEAIVENGVEAATLPTLTTGAGNVLAITGYTDNGDGTYTVDYSYTLNSAKDHEQPQDDTELFQDFAVSVTDSDGDTDSGTLTVEILDDVPTAENVGNTVPQGSFDPIEGNAMTDGTPDTEGADTARVTEVVVGNNAPVSVPESGTVDVTGEYGVLTIEADGSYSYARNPGTPGGVQDVFTYTLTDADGDSDTATLTIGIGDAPVTISGLSTEGPDLTVDEANLEDGSSPDDGALTQTGSFTITALDGVADLTVGGEAIVENGVEAATLPTLTTGAGNVLAITGYTDNGDGTYTVDYSYTLNSAKDHEQPQDDTELFQDFAVSVTDSDGDTDSGTLTVEILDDVPTAENVGNTVPQGSFDPIEGNAMTDGTPDTEGADTARVTEVVVGNNAPVSVPESGTVDVTGEYGVLTIEADGSYSYARNPGTPGGVQDVFTYTLTDADGDSDTATLTIGIGDAPVTISGLSTEGPDLTVDEANLEDGSSPDDGALTQTGSFTITALDGVADLTVGGEAIVENGVEAATLPTLTTGAGNVLAITGYTDNGDGTYTVDYSYTLNSAKDHEQPQDDTELFQDFAVSVTDSDGDTDSGTLTVEILDDVPTAENVGNTVPQGSFDPIEGNAMTDGTPDTEGADTARVTEVVVGNNAPVSVPESGTVDVTGEYGVLTIEADGSYSYARNPGTPGGVQDVFTYTLTDADGDSDTATLTIGIGDAPVTISGLSTEGPDLTVDEANLEDGSSPDDGALTQTGSFTITALDGVADLTVGGEAIVENGVEAATLPTLTTGAGNVLAITGYTVNGDGTYTVDYSYTLKSAKDHEQPQDDTELFQDFAVSVTDSDGDTASGTLTVEILDDVPAVEIDDQAPGSVAEDASEAIGGDITVTEGADQDATLAITLQQGTLSQALSFTLDGTADSQSATVTVDGEELGALTVTVAANGDVTWSFDPNAVDNSDGDPSFTFVATVTDADGDERSDSHTVTITAGDAPLDAKAVSLSVDEANLPEGSDPLAPGETVVSSQTLTFTAGSDAFTSIVFGTDLSDLVRDSDPENAGEEITWVRSDTQITGSVDGEVAVTLNLTNVDEAAGTATVEMVLSTTVPHEFGDDLATELNLGSVTVVATDVDGRTATGVVNLEVIDDVPAVEIDDQAPGSVAEDASEAIGGDITVTEGADQDATLAITLQQGTLSQALSFALDGTADSQSATVTVDGEELGDLTVTVAANGDVTWSFDPNAVDNSDGDPSFTFVATVTDADGDERSDSHTVTITAGDAPLDAKAVSLSVDEANLPEGSDPLAPGETVVSSQTLTFTAGSGAFTSIVFGTDLSDLVRDSDPENAGEEITWVRSDTQITGSVDGEVAVTLNLTNVDEAAGTATVEMVLSTTVPHEFGDDLATELNLGSVTVVATDVDGRTATGVVNLEVIDDVPAVEIDDQAPGSVAEDASEAIGGDITVTEGADQDATLAITLQQGTLSQALSFTLDGTADSQSATVTVDGEELGALTVTVAANGDVTWSFDPNAVDNSDGDPSFTFVATVTDADGDERSDSHTVTITAGDAPLDAKAVSLSVDEANLPEGSDPLAPGETVVSSQTLTFTAGSDAFTSIVFGTDLSDLVRDSDPENAGEEITWVRSDTQITGSVDGEVAVTLNLTNVDEAAGTATVEMVLSTTVPHEFGDDLATELNLGSVTVVATDVDGRTATGVVNLEVIDDVPAVEIDDQAPGSVAEDASEAIGGDITVTEGADQDATLAITLQQGTLSQALSFTLDGTADSQSATVTVDGEELGALTVTVAANGDVTWSFDPNAVDNSDGDPSFTFVATVTDADGDERSDSHTVTITAGDAPLDAKAVSLSVDEANLPEGSDPLAPGETVVSSQTLTFTAGSDAFTSIVFGTDLSDLVRDSDPENAGEEITWVRSDTQITGSVDGEVAVTLNLTNVDEAAGTATVEMVLSTTVPHEFGDDLATELNLGSVTVVATDVDGRTATGVVNLEVIDDVPIDFSPDATIVEPGDVSTSESLNSLAGIGADGIDQSSYQFGDSIGTGDPVVQGTSQIYLDGEALVWFRVSDTELQAQTLDGSVVAFEVDLNPSTDSYTVNNVADGVFGLSQALNFPSASDLKAGNDNFYIVQDLGNTEVDVLLSGTSGGSAAKINNNANGFGVDGQGQAINNNEVLKVEFFTDLTVAGGTGYVSTDPRPGATSTSATSFSFNISGVQANGTASFDIVWVDGNGQEQVDSRSGNAGDKIDINFSEPVEWFEIRGTGTQDFIVTLNGVGALIEQDVFVDIPVSVMDQDGDSADGSVLIGIDSDNDGNVTGVNAPITIDLDGNGIEYLSLDAGVMFADDSTGESVNTAWIGPNDGLLVIDANNSGTVDETREYVFTEWSETAQTDMEAVREVFDTNNNGMLDPGDEAWSQFAVWQDANSDGKTDEGELVSLGDLGVESIALNYAEASEGRTDADGDVVVFGQSQVNWTDGSVTIAEDASFAITASEVLSEEADEDLFQGDGSSSHAKADASYSGEQADVPATGATSFEDLDTSSNSIE